MGTAIESGVFALIGTVVGGLISFTTTAWSENRRLQEERLFRNHSERVHTAADYLTAFDNYRRGIRDNDPAYVELARAHATELERVRLWFEDSVFRAARKAGEHLLEMKENPAARDSVEKQAIDARNETMEAMRKQLGEGNPEQKPASARAAGK